VNKEGKIISESRFLSRSETAKSPFDTVGIRSVLDQKQGTAVYTNYVGREVLGSYLWLPRYEWGILAEMGMDEILWPLKWIKVVAILTSLLVSAVCFLMAYAVSRRIAGPIGEIADAARRMTEGELEQRIVFTSRDEVGILARSFNTMAQQVSRLIQSLHQKEDSLQKAYDELVATQDQLVQSERMAAIGELVACVAHEMRNPLSSVKLNLQILEMDLDKDEVLSEHCQIALDQVAQLERMFSDLLNYSKPLVLEKDDVRPRDLVNRSLEQLDGEITAGNIRIVSREDPDVSLHLMADADKIVQVLVNVLKNAMEASPPGGQVEIATHVDKTARESMIEISVIDQGPGIPARNLQSIFQPFFTTKKKGTGLGLCIVKKIMDAHHGMVSISSEKGKGTTVRLALPLARGAV
jgi:signal transduction histidine kinase